MGEDVANLSPFWQAGDDARIASPRKIFDQPPCEKSLVRSNLDDHVGDHVILSPL